MPDEKGPDEIFNEVYLASEDVGPFTVEYHEVDKPLGGTIDIKHVFDQMSYGTSIFATPGVRMVDSVGGLMSIVFVSSAHKMGISDKPEPVRINVMITSPTLAREFGRNLKDAFNHLANKMERHNQERKGK